MSRPSRVSIYLGATGMWAIAVLGAIGVSKWLALDARSTLLVVIGVALVAIVGTFLPAVRLGLARRRE